MKQTDGGLRAAVLMRKNKTEDDGARQKFLKKRAYLHVKTREKVCMLYEMIWYNVLTVPQTLDTGLPCKAGV